MSYIRSALEILDEIERLLSTLYREVPPSTPSEERIKSLVETVAKLSEPKKARPAQCPPNYVDWWKRVGASSASELPNRAIRYLSWETDIAILPEFQSIALSPVRISARSIQGIVRSIHRRWNSVGHSLSISNIVLAVNSYGGKNALIDKWRMGVRYVLTSDSPARLAQDLVLGVKTWEIAAKEWGLEPDTEFGNQVLEECVNVSLAAHPILIESHKQNVINTVLPSQHWILSSFKAAVQQLILASSDLSQQHSELLKNFILRDSRLLDPRLPANGINWVGICDSAQDIVIHWLSGEDIQLFFDHVLPSRNDPHGRKPFWMKYKTRVKRSRPLLSYTDKSRWQANAVTQNKHNFGHMEYSSDTSAFLLDFGEVTVVEFSKVGNAAYVYRNRDISQLLNSFWSPERFAIRKLKRPENCIDKIIHTNQWQNKMRTLLAQYGIGQGG